MILKLSYSFIDFINKKLSYNIITASNNRTKPINGPRDRKFDFIMFQSSQLIGGKFLIAIYNVIKSDHKLGN